MIIRVRVVPLLIYYLNNIPLALALSQKPNLLNKHELRKQINTLSNGKHGDKMFLNVDESEYPRANKTLRRVHKQQWLDYYKCLERTYADARHDRITYPNALVALEGTSVTLECRICISPMEIRVTSLTEWYFGSSNSSGESNSAKSTLWNTDYRILNSPDNRYVTMYNVKLEQAGTYWCEVGDTIGSVYYLHIDSDLKTVNVQPPDSAVMVENVPEYKLRVHTAWTTWSPCSTCDAVGIKLRYGYCTVSLLEMSEHRYLANESTPTTNQHTKPRRMKRAGERNRARRGVMQADVDVTNTTLSIQLRTVLMLFRNKLPCKSRLLPEQVRQIPGIKERKTAIMSRYCKKTCERNIIFQVRDEKGNVLESANNSAGIFSMIQGIPEALPSIARSVIYEKHNKKMKLVCPGNLNADTPIVWRIDDKAIIPSHIKLQSNGRIRINPQMQILFEPLKFEDANTYSCWQNNEVAGIIKLNVIGEMEFRLSHHVILIGAAVIISVVLITFWRAFKGRTRYTMH
ncbi:PREDICTED: uncharacterized protein LOC105565780 [Vollenhovia emeryi]|uniref:uncharacterized protein LOC105565780 n=1 Tax=Vollenhovia emeryi TaxID=411798 RepID=UPI0005F48FC4|nr:PREDICTED: uncharacterized protein LOC105565780 [Vollenhovia emeryi]